MHKWCFLLLLAGCSPQAPVQGPTSTPKAVATPTATAAPLSGWIDTSTDKIPPPDMGHGLTLVADHKGRPNKALHFDGQGSYFKVNMDINPSVLPEFTFHAWVRFTGDPADVTSRQIFSHDDGEYDRTVGIDPRGKGGFGWCAFVGDHEVLGTLPLKKDEWVMLTAVYNHPKKTAALYINEKVIEDKGCTLGTGLKTLTVGANPTFGENFIGDIEDIGLYGRSWTPEDVAKAYKEQK